jgi:hypothetical protein
MRLQNMSYGIIIRGDIAKGRTKMVDWFILSLSLIGFFLAGQAYLGSALSRNPRAKRVLKISCTTMTGVSIIILVLAFLHL